jgi:hypothetical protein
LGVNFSYFKKDYYSTYQLLLSFYRVEQAEGDEGQKGSLQVQVFYPLIFLTFKGGSFELGTTQKSWESDHSYQVKSLFV